MMELTVKSRAEWRRWLKTNHRSNSGVWLVFHKKHTNKKTDLDYDAAVEEALCYGWIDSIIKKLDDDRFVRKFTPRKRGSVWSESNKKRVDKLFKQGLMTDAGIALVTEAKKRGAWTKSSRPEISLHIPPELKRALSKNKKARAFFETLAATYQKHFIGWIAVAKRPETRARRLAESIRLLEQGKKLGLK